MQTTPNLPTGCKTSGHCFKSERRLPYSKAVLALGLRCKRCGATMPEKTMTGRKFSRR